MRPIYALILGLLITLAAANQYLNHRFAPISTFDEVIHIHLGKQIASGSGQYNMIALSDEYKSKKRKHPPYFRDPLYKHPPLFPFLVGISLKLGLPAITPAILLGSLMILLCFWICRIFLDEKMSLIGAFLLSIDPIINGCSQKIWLDAPLAFLMTASLLCFLEAIHHNKKYHFLWAGLWAGLAALTKYPGLLLIGCYCLWVLIYQRRLFLNPYFLACLAIPILLLCPWLYLYFSINHQPSLSLTQQHYFPPSGQSFNTTLLLLLTIFAVTLLGYWLNTKKALSKLLIFILKSIKYALFTLIAVIILANLMSILNFWQAPSHSWEVFFFKKADASFYLSRLIQYSPILLLGLFALLPQRQDAPALGALRIYTLAYLCTMTLWGSFQSRYIVPVVPALMVLSIIQFNYLAKNQLIKYLLVFLLTISLLKTLGNHLLLLFANNFGYF